MIYEVKSYADDEGRRITERLPIKQDSEALSFNFSSYIGIVVIQTQMGNVPVPFEFPIGYTIEKCFGEFDALAEKKIEEIKNASKIIPASGMPMMQQKKA